MIALDINSHLGGLAAFANAGRSKSKLRSSSPASLGPRSTIAVSRFSTALTCAFFSEPNKEWTAFILRLRMALARAVCCTAQAVLWLARLAAGTGSEQLGRGKQKGAGYLVVLHLQLVEVNMHVFTKASTPRSAAYLAALYDFAAQQVSSSVDFQSSCHLALPTVGRPR